MVDDSQFRLGLFCRELCKPHICKLPLGLVTTCIASLPVFLRNQFCTLQKQLPLIKLHEEIGFGDPANAGYHELFREVLGITSYGHRLLLLAELEELIGPVKWRRR